MKTLTQISTLAALLLLSIAHAQNETQSDASEQADDQTSTPTPTQTRRVRRLGDSMAPTEEWSPNQNNNVQRQVDRKLNVARQALANGNLTTPENQSALFYFQSVLELQPDNAEALAGIDTIAQSLVDQAVAAQAANNRNQALQIINQVQNLRPDFPGLDALIADISRNDELDALVNQATAQVQNQQYVSPAGDNAVETYQAILAIDSSNQFALQGLVDAETAVLSGVPSLVSARQYDQAEALITSAESILGGSEQITAARASIAAEQQVEIQEKYTSAVTAFEAGDYDQASNLIGELRGVNYDEAALASLEQQIEEERVILDFQAGTTLQDSISPGVDGPMMVIVPRGEFEMGSSSRERERSDNEGPQLDISIRRPFAMSQTEVTVAQFRAFVEDTNYVSDSQNNAESTIYNVLAGNLRKRENITWQNDFQGQEANPDDPVVHVSWNDATAYANWLSSQTGERYRLPSESEFEYALRAGTDTPYYWGRNTPRSEIENLTGERDKMAQRWEWPVSFDNYDDGHWGPAPAANYTPNPFNLYDMGGNVMEWTRDCYRSDLSRVPTDGSSYDDASCTVHVIRGGSWAGAPATVRSASRTSAGSTTTSCLLGFRVARDL